MDKELEQDMDPPITNLTDGNYTKSAEDVAKEIMEQDGHFEMVAWAIGCGAVTLFIFMLATIQYIRKVLNTPEAKRKRKKHMHKHKRAQEEKQIEETAKAGPVPVQDFPKALRKKKEKGLLTVEFKALGRKAEEGHLEVAGHPDNAQKNAHPDALPYDHCLVELESPPAASKYINASIIDSYDEKKVYIAAQGPCRGAIGDFWHLVWQQNVRVIVMATNVFEHARQQCEKYWHNVHARYDGIDVWLDHTDILSDFSVRTFRVKLEGSKDERIIKHFQFASWSDHDCPNPSSVLECRRRVRVWMAHNPGPMLVHCGAGAGRTGAFIAIDCALEQVATRKAVDIFNYVLYLRGCRQYMVRDQSQYSFIYNTVDMYIQCGETVINLRDLSHVVKTLSTRIAGTRMNGFESEFKILQKVVSPLSVGECAGGHRSENRRKSRDIMLQPPERARPYLITHDSNESTDYINAVYVDGYRQINAFIVTQWPLKSTINDIWRLIYDYNIPSMVLLNDMSFSRSFPCFWPRTVGTPTSYGPLTIELVEENIDDHIASRLFKIKKPKKYTALMEDFMKYLERKSHVQSAVETLVSLQAMAGTSEESYKMIRMFQLRCWPNKHKVPTSANALLELLTRVDDWQKNQCHGRIPTLVVSKNGVSRCGCYCAISHAWEKLKIEGEVDIFRAVKNIKTNRPQLVENLKELKFVYNSLPGMVQCLKRIYPECQYFEESEIQDTKPKSSKRDSRTARSVTPDNLPRKQRVNRLPRLSQEEGHSDQDSVRTSESRSSAQRERKRDHDRRRHTRSQSSEEEVFGEGAENLDYRDGRKSEKKRDRSRSGEARSRSRGDSDSDKRSKRSSRGSGGSGRHREKKVGERLSKSDDRESGDWTGKNPDDKRKRSRKSTDKDLEMAAIEEESSRRPSSVSIDTSM